MAELMTTYHKELYNSQVASEINHLVYLPQLSDDAADEVYERMLEAERAIASPNMTRDGYEAGVAQVNNQILAQMGSSATVLTAEHATAHRRLNKHGAITSKVADYGTGGLARILYEDSGAWFITMLGKQTADAAKDVEHPLKTVLGSFVASPQVNSHISLHAMRFGRVASSADQRGYNVVIGVGDQPSDESVDLAKTIQAIGSDYDLRVGINSEVAQYQNDNVTPQQTADGAQATIRLAASSETNIRSYAQKTASELGKRLATAQLELGGSVRLLPYDHSMYPGVEAQRRCVYAGYLFLKDCLQYLESSA